MTRPFFALASLFILAGCNDKSTDYDPASTARRTRSVIEFLETPETLEATWAECRNDLRGVGATQDCANAGDAKQRLMVLGRERALQSLRR